ncbi:ricin-type beta-trefoil lectin domain protein [Actinoplanes sp. TBRC 11911]|uniref:RICIN domain-containing protein n=1 Tax=Actinoplanes sp. TBRC 11911 TaxID=2729386 RepID=UPI00145F1118|nr:RICIN domain-containing protein [Actinoplanes sp. TBRC 11911]NMO51884.1 ricin-type beta-trefoil lectin domain protein [Actinoplanes sp. TBRC 11911]
MTENHDDATERTEPVLVRPYVKTNDDEPASAETWPAAYREKKEETDTVVQPVVVDEEPPAPVPSRRRPRLVLRLLALIVGVALAGGAAYLVLGDNDSSGAQPAALLPRPDDVAPTGDAPSAPGRTTPSAKVSSSASASASASASIPASVPAAPPVSGSVAPPTQQTTTTAPAAPGLDPPPAADRSGKVTAASGRCLMRGGLLGVDGSPVQVADCGLASTFTLAADGTLRVSGRCAQITGDGTVRIDDCAGQASAQWRGGPGDSLVNPASGQCLTDPGRSGATAKAAACTGGSEQTWALP